MQRFAEGPFLRVLNEFIAYLDGESYKNESLDQVKDRFVALRKEIYSIGAVNERVRSYSDGVEVPPEMQAVVDAMTLALHQRIGTAMTAFGNSAPGFSSQADRLRADRLAAENSILKDHLAVESKKANRLSVENTRLQAENIALKKRATPRTSQLDNLMESSFGPLVILGFDSADEFNDFAKKNKRNLETVLLRRGQLLWHPDKIESLAKILPNGVFASMKEMYAVRFRNCEAAASELASQLQSRTGVTNSWKSTRPV